MIDELRKTKANITIIILTYNEEKLITDCLESIFEWANQIIVIDSNSNDKTLDIARKYTTDIYIHTWESFAKQREWAVKNVQIQNDWILFLDADERLTEPSREEISKLLLSNLKYKGYFIRRRFYFLDKWLRYGDYYPSKELRLFTKQKIRFVDEGGGARERFFVSGDVGHLKTDIIHIYNKGIENWVKKHIKLANLEVSEKIENPEITENFEKIIFGSPHWLRLKIWRFLPKILRPFLLFFYRYFIRFGFLDGIPGLYYCFLHDLWYPMFIEILRYEKTESNDGKI